MSLSEGKGPNTSSFSCQASQQLLWLLSSLVAVHGVCDRKYIVPLAQGSNNLSNPCEDRGNFPDFEHSIQAAYQEINLQNDHSVFMTACTVQVAVTRTITVYFRPSLQMYGINYDVCTYCDQL